STVSATSGWQLLLGHGSLRGCNAEPVSWLPLPARGHPAEKDAAANAASDSGLTAKGFGVFWVLRGDAPRASAGVNPMTIAREAYSLMARFPNAAVNATSSDVPTHGRLFRALLSLHLANWRAFDVARHRPRWGKSSNNPAREARQMPRS